MAAFGSIIYVVILIFIVSSVVKRAKKAGGTLNNPAKPALPVAGKPARRTGFTNYRPHKDIISVNRDMGDAKGSSTLRDDRNNDWLAMQLREEAKARVRMSDMFQMKTEHSNKCDAEFIKRFHESNCDADGIDTGISKGAKNSTKKR